MVVGLQPLEFTDCILDSPDFRENLNKHEKELEKTSQQIKRIIKEVKDLLAASKNLSRAQRTLAKSLAEFNFECIGSTQTDDEQVIVDSLKQFSKLITGIEDERDNVLARAHDQIVVPLENFRKERIGGVKENKKKFDKKTSKFCQAQERFLNMSSKKPDNTIQEADASLGMLEREYLRESLSYVFGIQDVQERIKFEFVETLLSFMSGWLVFYHLGHEVSEDAKEYMNDLQHKVQKTRENFDETRTKAEELKSKYMDSKMKPETEYTKQGYLFLMEKSKIKAFTATWSKYYCTYKKQQKQFTMLSYNQISGRTETPPENLTLVQCTRRASDFEKRFCFDLTFEQRPGITFTFQALSEEDRKVWLNAMDGKEPTYLAPGKSKTSDEYLLDDIGFTFIRKCVEVLENRGLEEEGLYRVGGVNTKIIKLIQLGMDRQKTDVERLQFFYDEQYSDLLETKTISSALKHYLRNLTEPIMTFRYHNGFIAAAKQETRIQRISDVHTLIYRIPKPNFEMLEIVIKHLRNVANKSLKNKMSVFNLGVVFGPTLLRAVEETLAAILDIKFNNVVIEILIENYDLIFKNQPGKVTDYLTYSSNSSPPEPIPRTYGGYRSHRNTLNNQPIVRVVARSNYTDTVMSSSLQNIPNGLAIYQNTTNNKNSKLNHSNIYDTTKTHHMNQSTPSLNRDVTSSNPNSHNPSPNHHHNYLQSSTGTTTAIATHPNNNLSNSGGSLTSSNNSREKLMHNNNTNNNISNNNNLNNINRDTNLNLSRETNLSTITSRGGSESIYSGQQQLAQQTRLNSLSYSSENSLHHPPSIAAAAAAASTAATIIDRINSTSSSNESVYSASSISHPSPRQQQQQQPQQHQLLQHQQQQQQQPQPPVIVPPPNYLEYNNLNSSYGLRGENDNNLNFMPKKTQRTKDIGRTRYNSPRDKVRVRTLYACLAENDGELSFEPNQIITNVRSSNEPGWLEGTLNGKSGLIPENYVEILP